MQNSSNPISNNYLHKRGQVVVEYVMILTFVACLLTVTKLKVTPSGQIDLSGQEGSSTIMSMLSESFTVWMRDIIIIISLPS